MSPLQIAVFSYGLPVVGQKRGGIERVAHDLADGLARRGHRVTVFTYDPKPPEAAYEVAPLPWRGFVTSWLGRRLTMGYLGNILALLPRYGSADVLITLGDSLLIPLLGKPHVRIMAGSALGEAFSARSPWRFVMQMGVYAQELLTALTHSGCVAISHNTRRYNPLIRHVIPLGIDQTLFFPANERKTDEPSILFVGTLNGRKRGRLLIKQFTEEVRPRHPRARLRMVSNPGPQLDGVSYHTGISGSELAELYRRAWIYVSPSTYEGFGLPYVEAMASGTPVVATPNPGSREVLGDGRFGILVEDADLGTAIADLVGDVARRNQLITNGLERAQAYSLHTTLDLYENLLRAVCASPTRPREAV